MTMDIYADIEPQADRPFGIPWPSLQLTLMGLTAANIACRHKDVAEALQALHQLQSAIAPEQGQGMAELFVLYRSLAYLIELNAWDAVTPVLDALLDACLQTLAEATAAWPARKVG